MRRSATTATRPAELPADLPARMRAVVQDGYGDAGTFRLAEVDRPVPEPGQVLVEVRAAAIDRGTWHLMAGLPLAVRPVLGLKGPRQPVPGRDLAGVVVATGEDVTRLLPGDEVYGTASGSLAEYAVTKERQVALKPARLTFAQAAAVPVSGLTALQALTDAGRLQAGQHVLVLGASGGVGSYAVQIAKALGATVTGTASTAKLAFVRSLGADAVLDHQTGDPLDGPARYDLVLDGGGNRPLRRLRGVLTPKGTLVVVGGEGGGRWLGGIDRQGRAVLWSPFVPQRLTSLVSKEDVDGLHRLTALIDAGSVTPAVERTYPLEEAAEAMRRLAAGDVQGKVAITL